jgi:hypothetical protein
LAAYKHIKDNLPGAPGYRGSFCERLAEQAVWDSTEFWKAHGDLVQAARETRNSKTIDRELAAAVVAFYSRICFLLVAHYDKNDPFKISCVLPDDLYAFCERLRLAVIGVFTGEVLPESSFYLQNPLILGIAQEAPNSRAARPPVE